MARRMSCAMTIPAVRNRTKTVTRRHVDTWTALKPRDRLTLIEKGMGLPKGAKQVVLAEVEVTDVRVEPLGYIYSEGAPGLGDEGVIVRAVQARGFDLGRCLDWFVSWWAGSHGYGRNLHPDIAELIECRRIEWRYLDEETDR